MKKLLLTIQFVFFAILIFAQAPQAFKYQAVVRDDAGEILANQNVSFRISIIEGNSPGVNVYSEYHNVSTNQFGLVNIEVGNGTVYAGVFEDVNWQNESCYLQLEMDPEGGSSYVYMGTAQLMSVPYALYSENTANIDDADSDPANELQALSIDGSDLSISDGNTVTLPSNPGDNLGNHTATQNIKLNGNWLTNDGDEEYEGLFIDDDGDVGIGPVWDPLKLSVWDTYFSSNNNIENVVEIARGTTWQAEPGIGAGLLFRNEINGGFYVEAGRISGVMENINLSTRAAGLLFQTTKASGYTNALYLDPDGNAGIGTNNPTTKLDVIGTVKASAFVGDGSALTGIAANNNWQISGNNMYNGNTGNVGIGTVNPVTNLEVSHPEDAWLRISADNDNSGGDDGTQNAYLQFTTDGGSTDFDGLIWLENLSGDTKLHFDVEGQETMVMHDGNVGIGTANPGTTLEVAHPEAAWLRIHGDNDYSGGYGTENAYLQFSTGLSGYNDGRIWLENLYSDAKLHFDVGNQECMVLHNGRVGIGTDVPATILSNSAQLAGDGTLATNHYGINWRFNGTGYALGIENPMGNGSGLLVDAGNYSGNTVVAHFVSANNSLMYIQEDGKIGIGTKSPGAPLEVSSQSSLPTVILDRATGQASIKSTFGEYLMLESNGNKLGLNWYTSDNVIMVNGGGNVGVGTASPATTFSNSSTLASDGTKSTSTNGVNWRISDNGYAFGIENTYGAGSGLLVDAGNNGGVGATVAHFVSNDASLLIIREDGNVGIGTTNPSQRLAVYNGSTTGTYTTSGWQHSSDARLKTNISQIDNALDKVMEMEGVYFDWKDNKEKHQVGLIAQDVEKVLPEVVNQDEEGFYSVSYGGVVPVLIEAIKEQQKEIEKLKEMINKLNN